MTGTLYVVQFRARGSLACEAKTFGPFLFWTDAADFLDLLPVARDCEYKFIDTLTAPTRENVADAFNSICNELGF